MTDVTANVPGTADREAIDGELRRIFVAPQFNHSPVMRRLLSFLVDQTLAGNGPRLKAYTIAVDALGRDADFDARIDSYPRVQVGRLRKLLDEFYTDYPSNTGLRIHIPKGAYIVDFEGAGITSPQPRVQDESPNGIPVKRTVRDVSAIRTFDLGRFAAAALVGVLVSLIAWQALGGLAHADQPFQQSGVEADVRQDEYRRCSKVIAADRCREMLSRESSPNAL